MLHLSVKFNMKSTSNQNNTNEETNKQYERFSSEVIEDESIKPITISSVTIDKNKLGISDSGGSSIMSDNLAGGRIVESFEIFQTLAKSKGLLTAKGAYISLNDALKDKYKDLEVDHVDLKTGEIKTKKAIDNWVYKELVRSHGMADIVKKEILGYYFKNIIAIRNEYKQIYQIAQSKKLPSPIDYPTMLLEYNVTDSEYPKSE